VKIRRVEQNNKKKCFEVTTAKGTFTFPFSRLKNTPKADDRVDELFVDKELGSEAFTYRLSSGKEGSVHVDQVLEYNQDPDYMRQTLLYKLSIQAQKLISMRKIPKREVIRRMHTSPTQFYRLIDQTNYQKTIDQMVKLLAALDCPVDVVFQPAT